MLWVCYMIFVAVIGRRLGAPSCVARAETSLEQEARGEERPVGRATEMTMWCIILQRGRIPGPPDQRALQVAK
eukprot:scaffold15482_cov121-Skeletonema_dohrnii-CCMP3373.AAC.1